MNSSLAFNVKIPILFLVALPTPSCSSCPDVKLREYSCTYSWMSAVELVFLPVDITHPAPLEWGEYLRGFPSVPVPTSGIIYLFTFMWCNSDFGHVMVSKKLYCEALLRTFSEVFLLWIVDCDTSVEWTPVELTMKTMQNFWVIDKRQSGHISVS